MNVKTLLLTVPALLAVPLLAACGGSSAGVATAPAASSASSSSAGSSAAAPQGAAGGTAKAPADTVIQPVPEGQRVQRTAQITLEVPDGRFSTVLNTVTDIVLQNQGYTAGTQAQADGSQRLRSGQASFQVPVDHFESVMRAITQQGTPQSISRGGNDVSQQYVDLQARLRNAEAQRDAMLALMQQARSVSDTIQIQNQLGQVTGQIEQINGQIQYIEHSTAYAAIAVTIREAAAGPADEWGVQTAARQALHNLATVAAVLILVLGSLLPVIVVVAAAGFAAWRLWPRLRSQGQV
jgi:Domain of unknown function (DUF4349)